MGACKALLMAGAVIIGTAGAALAADLPPPPMIEAPPEPLDVGGWYLRGDVGVGIASSPALRSSFDEGFVVPDARFDQQSLGDAAFVGGGVGYQFNSWLRFDLTGEYRTSQSLGSIESYNCSTFGCADDNPNDTRGFDKYIGSVQSTVALFNTYADLGTWYQITPFIGGGIGGSFNRVYGLSDTSVNGPGNFGVGGFGYAKSKDSIDLAWALMAGLSYAVTPNLKLELAYRYLNMGTAESGAIVCQNTSPCGHEVQRVKLESQDVKLGMRWMFNDVAPVQPIAYEAPPPPIVRKY